MGRFAEDTRRSLDAALRALPDIELHADASDADREIANIRRELAELSNKRIGVDVDAAQAKARLDELGAQLRDLSGRSADVRVQADTAAAAAALGAVEEQVRRVDGQRANVKVDVDRSLSDSLIQVTRLGQALQSLALPAAAIAAAPQLAAIGAAALSASGAIGVLPAAAGAAGLAITTLKVGVIGFGDAMKNLGDPAKFGEAIAKLAPQAREAAEAIRGLKPAWDALQQSVQNQLFSETGQRISDLGRIYLPILQKAMVAVADAFNAAVHDVADFFDVFEGSREVADDVAEGMDFLAKGIRNVTEGIGPAVQALYLIGRVGAEVFADATAGVGELAQKFADFIGQARASGQLEQWMRAGIDTVKQLGAIVTNVGSIFLSVFGAAREQGASLLDTLQRITGEVAAFLRSAEGQNTLREVFTEIKAGVDAAMPGLKAIAAAVLDVIRQLAQQDVLRRAGEAFTSIAQAAAPVIQNLGELAARILPPLLAVVKACGPELVAVATALLGLKLASSGLDKLRDIGTWLGLIRTAGGGIAGPLGGAAVAIDNTGTKAAASAGLLGRFRTALSGISTLGVAVALGAVAVAMDKVNESAANGKPLTGWAEQLHDITGAAKQILTGDFGSIFDDIRGEFDALVGHWKAAKFEPIEITASMNVDQAQAAYDGLIRGINTTGVTVNINGNTVPIGHAYNRVLEEIRQGKAEVNIDGRTVPAQEALEHIRQLADQMNLMVTVNGQTMPLSQAIELAHQNAVNKRRPGIPVDGDTVPFENRVRDGVGWALSQNVKLTIDGNVDPATGKITQLITMANGQSAKVIVDGNPDPATGKINGVIQWAQGQTGTVQIDGNQTPVNGKITATVTYANGQKGTIQLDADPSGANSKIAGVRASASVSTVMPVGADTSSAGASVAAVQNSSRLPQSFGVGADTGAAQGQVGTVQGAARTPQTMPVNANTGSAQAQVGAVQGTARIQQTMPYTANPAAARAEIASTQGQARTPQTFGVGANTSGAWGSLANLWNSWINKVITWVVRIITPGHDGMIFPAQGFAEGGSRRVSTTQPTVGGSPTVVAQAPSGQMTGPGGRRLTRTSGSQAFIAKPNSFRIIGDRADKDEFFLPDNNAPLSMALGSEWARRRGLMLVPATKMATGGSVRYGSVSQTAWNDLLAAGWRGIAGDKMEALYAPTSAVKYGSVSDTAWRALLALGWRGMPGDRQEALYPPGAAAAPKTIAAAPPVVAMPPAAAPSAATTAAGYGGGQNASHQCGDLSVVAAELRRLGDALRAARPVTVDVTNNNPIAERGSESTARALRTLSAMGLFGGSV